MSAVVATPLPEFFGTRRQSVTEAGYSGDRFPRAAGSVMLSSETEQHVSPVVQADPRNESRVRAEAQLPVRTPVFSSPWAALFAHLHSHNLRPQPAQF